MRGSLPSSTTARLITHSATFFMDGMVYMMSSMMDSMTERRPRAPVSSLMALAATAFRALVVNFSSTPSSSNIFLY